MFTEAEQLRDIHATMGSPWWPPAPGWWLLLGALALIALVLWRFDRAWRVRVPIPVLTLGTWRWDAGRSLRHLRKEAAAVPAKQTASELSELLRRIAMARFGRMSCAGLHGDEWLAWLAEHDPKGFDWRTRGRLLLETPYARTARPEADRAALLALADATLEWVLADDPKPVREKPSRARRALLRIPLLRRLAVDAAGATGA
jgi:hypothetical protein